MSFPLCICVMVVVRLRVLCWLGEKLTSPETPAKLKFSIACPVPHHSIETATTKLEWVACVHYITILLDSIHGVVHSQSKTPHCIVGCRNSWCHLRLELNVWGAVCVKIIRYLARPISAVEAGSHTILSYPDRIRWAPSIVTRPPPFSKNAAQRLRKRLVSPFNLNLLISMLLIRYATIFLSARMRLGKRQRSECKRLLLQNKT